MVLDPRNTKTYRRAFNNSLITKGDPGVAAVAQRLANQRMRVEILPSLGVGRIRASSWNPLRADVNGPSAYGMKLWINDKLAREILQDGSLMLQTEQIVVESVIAAATVDTRAFVQHLLDHVREENDRAA